MVCARCATRVANNARATPSTAPAAKASVESSTPTEAPVPSWRDHWLALTVAWALVISFGIFYYDHKLGGSLGRSVSASLEGLANGGLDGRYVFSEYGYPMTVRVAGTTGSMDLGPMRIEGMRVQRSGNTVSMSGGWAFDAAGKPIDEETRQSLSGGNDVDLLEVGDDGQSLSLDLGDGKRAKFVRQR
ncbi:hypothetical protein EON82_23620 [bacterium]|nr:MAG: hypothetical protein EON82_23620 [bacterium]